MTPEDLARLRLSHLFLRSIDRHVVFRGFFPASIYVVRLKTSADRRRNFDYVDDIPTQCISVRLGEVGVIGVLNDGGLQEMLHGQQVVGSVIRHTLNPVQFKNLFAKCVYMQRKFTDPFRYEINADEFYAEIRQESVPRDSFGGSMVYGEWIDEEYAELLASTLRCEPSALRLPDGSVGSLFYDMHGNWKDRPFDDDGTRAG